MQAKKTHKIKVNATFHRLQINKNIKFQTKMQWKRHKNKGQTRLVNHEHGYSIYEQNIILEFNLVYDDSQGLYEQKNTQIVAVISHQGKIKSGGYAKYNISQVINQQLGGKPVKIPLGQCPDPHANVEVTFTYSLEEQGFSQVASVLNASSLDLNMSRIDFHDDKISLQMDRINSTITKLDELAHSLKNKQKLTLEKVPELLTKIQQLQGQKDTLVSTVKKLENSLEQKESEEKQRQKNDQKTIKQLEKQLNKKSKQSKSREFIEIDEEKKVKEELEKKEQEIKRYKNIVKAKQQQLEKYKSRDESQNNCLKEENNNLRNDVAGMSYKLARLFNAAYDYGDAKLLDYLQAAIGLTQEQ